MLEVAHAVNNAIALLGVILPFCSQESTVSSGNSGPQVRVL